MAKHTKLAEHREEDGLKILTKQSDLCIWSPLTEKPMSLKCGGQGY